MMPSVCFEKLLMLSKLMENFKKGMQISPEEFWRYLCDIDNEYCELQRFYSKKKIKLLLIGNRDSIFLRNLRKWFKALLREDIKIFSFSPWRLNYFSGDFKITSSFDDHFLYRDQSTSKLKRCYKNMSMFRNIVKSFEPSIIHLHYLTWAYFCEYIGLFGFAKRIPCIITIWGSDMFIEGRQWFKRFLQTPWLSCSSLITVGNEFLKEQFRDIYGSKHLTKIRIAAFGPPIDVVLLESYADGNYISNFSKRLGVDLSDKFIRIIISSSADSYENHFYILKELSHLPERIRRRLIVISPMTYGDMNYRERFENILKSESSKFHKVILIKDYMSDKDIIALRKISDITIFLPEHDAFSAFLQESIYLGNVVITGSWLPYGWIEMHEINVHKINKSPGELTERLIKIIKNFDNEKKIAKDNRRKILRLVAWQYNLKSWLKLYKEALENQRRFNRIY